MPYIKNSDRNNLDSHLMKMEITSAGNLNYCLTKLVQCFLGDNPRYDNYNSAIGALECCKLELYRRMIAPYEDKKIQENGDVYGRQD